MPTAGRQPGPTMRDRRSVGRRFSSLFGGRGRTERVLDHEQERQRTEYKRENGGYAQSEIAWL